VNITIRISDGLYYATLEGSEVEVDIEGVGDTLAEALKDLVEQLEAGAI
jgi:hypothetical protein